MKKFYIANIFLLKMNSLKKATIMWSMYFAPDFGKEFSWVYDHEEFLNALERKDGKSIEELVELFKDIPIPYEEWLVATPPKRLIMEPSGEKFFERLDEKFN
ncbi:hypothetical protein [Ruminococcus albus]|uniref:Uncharacterized protein n=1 Tax=Ruminococcus albus 8 TaxID=246199 RepID=E9S8Z1_RUMAL|nr:hypothetical protein [Ruminococcus albus]EGC04263.1 hypothetical protein CUS_5636 [Ruminococcus albus 8]MCC3349713.1 hypothetical protein [Ruminococcus albus 8]